MIKKLLAVFALLCAVFYLTIQPMYTVWGIQEGLQNRDEAQLERYVDFANVRDGLKTQLKDYLEQQATAKMGGTDSAMANLGLLVLGTVTDRMVEYYITPQGLQAVLGGQVDPAQMKAPPKNQVAEQEAQATEQQRQAFAEASYRYLDMNRFEVSLRNAERPDEPVVMLLERRGLSWQLTRIVLPLPEVSAE